MGTANVTVIYDDGTTSTTDTTTSSSDPYADVLGVVIEGENGESPIQVVDLMTSDYPVYSVKVIKSTDYQEHVVGLSDGFIIKSNDTQVGFMFGYEFRPTTAGTTYLYIENNSGKVLYNLPITVTGSEGETSTGDPGTCIGKEDFYEIPDTENWCYEEKPIAKVPRSYFSKNHDRGLSCETMCKALNYKYDCAFIQWPCANSHYFDCNSTMDNQGPSPSYLTYYHYATRTCWGNLAWTSLSDGELKSGNCDTKLYHDGSCASVKISNCYCYIP